MVISQWKQMKFLDDMPKKFLDGVQLYELVSTSTREAAQVYISKMYQENLKNYWTENI